MTVAIADTRFRLRRSFPLTWRADGVLQLGLDGDGVLLDGVPDLTSDIIRALDQPRSLTDLGCLVPDLPLPWLEWLLGELRQADLLICDDPPPPRLGLVGTGQLADTIAGMLRSVGLTEVTRAEVGATRSTSRRKPTSLATTLLHWRQLPDDWPELTIVATDSEEPDRALTDSLAQAGRTHLVVRLESDRAVVGPFVVPGLTPCVRCQDYTRCRYDAAWPTLVVQLSRQRSEIDPVLLSWAAATTVTQVRCQLSGATADAIGRTIELGADHVLRTRDWPVHPSCGCVLAAA